MVCPDCDTPNFTDYKFCRECGSRLEAPEPSSADEEREAQEEVLVEAFLTRAFEAMERGELDEALSNAEAALAMRPDSASARSVLGLIYERQGKISDAIREFEAVLELNPRSSADRAKLEALRGTSGGAAGRRITRGQAIGLGAAAAALALFAAGVVMFRPPSVDRAAASSERVATYISLPPGGAGRPVPAPDLSRSLADSAAGSPVVPPASAPNKPGSPVVMGARPAPGASAPRPAPREYTAEPGRYGLPHVIDRPAPPPAYGTPPARIGQVVPLAPGDAFGGSQAGANGGRTGAAGPAPDPGAAPQPRVEPIESETGFIRIEPVVRPAGSAAPRSEGLAPRTGARPRISVSLGSGPGSAPAR